MDLPTTYMSTVITWLSYAILLSGIYLLYRIVTELGEIKELMKAGQRPGQSSSLPLSDTSTQLGHDVDAYADNLLRQVQSSSQSSSFSNPAAGPFAAAPGQGSPQTGPVELDDASANAHSSLAQLDRAVETGAPLTHSGEPVALTGHGSAPAPAGVDAGNHLDHGEAGDETAGANPNRFEAARAKAGRSFQGTSAGSSLATAGLPASLASALASSPVSGSGFSGSPSATSAIRVPSAAPLKSVALKAMDFVPSQARGYQVPMGIAESAMNTQGAIRQQEENSTHRSANLVQNPAADDVERAAGQASLESASAATAVLDLPDPETGNPEILNPELPNPEISQTEMPNFAAPQATHAPIESTLSQLAKASAEHRLPQDSLQVAPVPSARSQRAEFADLDLPTFLPHGRREDDWADPAL